MKYIFRGHVVFSYDPDKKIVTQGVVSGVIPAFDFCHFIAEDYRYISEFFGRAYQHTQGKEVDLTDIEVN